MPKINIIEENKNTIEDIILSNGDLVIINSTSAYIVSSYDVRKTKEVGEDTNKYCTLIDLSTGKRVFEEPCSRNTTIERLLNHFRSAFRITYNREHLTIVNKDHYTLQILLKSGYTLNK